MPRLASLAACSVSLLSLAAAAAPPADDRPDLAVVHRIKAEAFENGKVKEHLFWLTDVNGPRLSGSPGYRAAADWAVKSLEKFGASKPRLEKWGTFGRGWSMSRYSAHLVSPVYAPLGGTPKAWTAGTAGAVTAEVVLAPLVKKSDREVTGDLEKLAARIQAWSKEQQGKLRGKVVLLDAAREFEQPKEPAAQRLTDAKLAELVQAPEPAPGVPVEWPLKRFPTEWGKRMALASRLPTEVLADFSERRRRTWDVFWAFLAAEGAAAVFSTDDRGDGGAIFAESTGCWDASSPNPPPAVVLAPEQYDRLVRLVEKKIPVKVELELQAQFHPEGAEGVNVVAELPGTGKKKDEVVMLGAHLDSWHAGTGATDNAAGVAVMLEAVRILKALDLPLDRTVRVALWEGEEEGLLGSRGYVKNHFGDPVTMALKPEHAKLAAYFNLDNGSGKVRGVWLQGNDMVRPIFEQWLAPFRDQGATTLTIRPTGGTDHQSFDAVGLPGFQFIQDPLDYMSRTHHSDLDVYDHVQAADLMQAAAVVATFAYQAANRPEMLPRKPLPKPLPTKRTGPGGAQAGVAAE